MDKHFSGDHKLHKFFYRSNMDNKTFTVACRILDQPSAHTTETSFTHLLTAKVEHATALRKQTALCKKNVCVKIHYIKQILVWKTFKRKFITAYQKQNWKQDFWTIKNPSNTKSTEDTQLSNEPWNIKASKEEPVSVWKMLG